MTLAGVFDPGPRLRGCACEGDLACAVDGYFSNTAALSAEVGLGSDATATQLLAAAYRRFGTRVLEHLRGDFAVMVWDPRARWALLARDQLGGRPLYVHRAGRRVVFASDVPALLARLASRPAPDRAAVLHWISGLADRDGRTLYDGVRALGPGRALILDGTGCREHWYWSPRYVAPLHGAHDELVAQVRAGMRAAVEGCMSGADDVGVLLSGGLDSSGIAALAARGRVIHGYSAVFPEHPTVDESALIAEMTAHLRIRGTRMAVRGGSMLWGAVLHVAQWQLPLRAQNLYIWRPLFRRAAADSVTVMLDGEGGDLLFAASRELMADRLLAARPRAALALARRLPGPGDRGWSAVLRLARAHGLHAALPFRLHSAARRLRPPWRQQLPPWLAARDAAMLRGGSGDLAWKGLDGPRWWAHLADSVTDGMEAVGIREQLLRRAQTAGIDGRSPLLDLELVELILRMPPELGFDATISRPLQRDALAGLVPDALRLRPDKSYFDELLQRSFAVADLDAVRRLLSAPDSELGAFLDRNRMQADLLAVTPARHPSGPRHWVTAAWRLASAEIWLRYQSDEDFPQRFLAGESLGRLDYLFPP